MQTQQLTDLKQYIDIISRRKVLILGGILLGITCGLIYYIAQPKIYQSEVLLSYQQQKLNPSQVSPDERAGLRNIVGTLTQIVMSPPSLEKIIQEENLYAGIPENPAMEDFVEIMRNDINIFQSGRGIVIEYAGSDPGEVLRGTNALAARFIEENLQYRKERAPEKSGYTEDELDMAKEMLDKKEAEMRDYELKYYHEMPDQRALNVSRMITQQDQYQEKHESIQNLERTRLLIQEKIDARKQFIEEHQKQTEPQRASEQDESTVININKKATLEMLQNSLVALKDSYTDQHPQVKRLKKRIASLEQIVKEEDRKNREDSASENQRQQYDDELISLQYQINDIGLSISKLEKEKEEIRALIQKYEELEASAPVREAEWSSLTREYGELKSQYDFMVAQNLQALSALNSESRQKRSQLKIVDPARVPETPIKPKFRKIMVMAMFAGLIAGGSIAVGLEIVDTSFKSQFEVEQAVDLSVICSVPNLALSGEIAKKRFWSVLKIAFFMIWIFIICLVSFTMRTEGRFTAYFMELIQ